MAKKIPEGIDSMAILNSIRPDSPSPYPTTPIAEDAQEPPLIEHKVKSSRRRKKEVIISDFEQNFIRCSELSARAGKLVYIRQEYHERINKIIRVIGKDQVSIFEYVDNVLTDHFERNEEQITKLYNEKLEGVY